MTPKASPTAKYAASKAKSPLQAGGEKEEAGGEDGGKSGESGWLRLV